MPTPAQDMYDAWKKSHDAFKRSTKKQRHESWDINNGWRNMPKQTPMRDLTSSAGNHYQLPEDDYEEYMTFYRSAVPSELSETYKQSGRARDVQTPADYIDRAFGKNTKGRILETDGKGHILHMSYARTYQILKVTFWNNNVVAYFRVPIGLAAHLFALALSDVTRPDSRGVQRHILGIRFWDLIRIRGTVHGSRYKFEYISESITDRLPGRQFASGSTGLVYSEAQKDKINKLSVIKELLEKGISPEQIAEIYDNASDDVGNISSPEKVQEAIDAIPKTTRKKYSDMGLKNEAAYRRADYNEHVNKRIKNINWDSARVTQLAEQLASDGKLGKGGIEMFNNKFPNAAEQFDYLRQRGYITGDARFTP